MMQEVTAMLELNNKVLIKNAMLLILVEWKANGLLLLMELVFVTLGLLFLPYSAFVALLIGFSLHQLFVCMILNPIIEKRIAHEKKA